MDGRRSCACARRPTARYWPRITTDGLGGAIITWPDYRYGGGTNVYAQMVDAAGAVRWDANGVVICSNMDAGDPELVYDGAGGAIIAWEDPRNAATSKDIYAQKIERNGFLGYPSATPTTAVDHPDDQGDRIILSWDASYLDEWPLSTVDHYSVWRRYGGTGARRTAPAAFLGARGFVDLETLAREGWIPVDDVDAMQFPEYGCIVPSFGDSTEPGTIWTDMMVLAHSTALGEYWMSDAVTGYSVDNLAPGAPLALGAEVDAPDIELTWSPSGYHDEDLSEYSVYRSEVSGFIPDETTLVGTATDTVFTDQDPGTATWHYVVSATDVHGNEGEVSNEASATLGTGVEDPVIPAVFALRGNHPNPFNPSTRIAFDLPEAVSVRLDVYSAAGRLVTTLADRVFEAGRHHVTWDGRDASPHALSSGVYLVRLTAGADVATHAMVLLK